MLSYLSSRSMLGVSLVSLLVFSVCSSAGFAIYQTGDHLTKQAGLA